MAYRRLLASVIAFGLAGCMDMPDNGGTAQAPRASAPVPVPTGKGRIAVLRTQKVMGFGVKPDVLVDGRPTGLCAVNSLFHVDVSPGAHVVSVSTLRTSTVNVRLAAGETAYVLCTVQASAVVGQPVLTQVRGDSVAKALGDVKFTGSY